MQSAQKPFIDEILEEMTQMRTELELVIKHITRGVEKINAVNYLPKPPPPNDECYYAEDSYAVNEQTGVFDRAPKPQIRVIGAKVKGTNVGSMVTIIVRVIMSEMETTTMKQLQQG